jgi:hypothetical protein
MGALYVIETPKANGLSFYLRHVFYIHLLYLALSTQPTVSWINRSSTEPPGICRATYLPR